MCHASQEVMLERLIKAGRKLKSDLKKCSMSDNLDGMENDYLCMNRSNSDGEDETEFNEVP